MTKQKRSEKVEVRVTPAEKEFLQKAAEKKDLSVSEFVRYVAVEMARSISIDASPEETYYAVLMGVGRVSPEVVLYSATADFSPSPEPEPEEEYEEET